jgi:hypothetical protein
MNKQVTAGISEEVERAEPLTVVAAVVVAVGGAQRRGMLRHGRRVARIDLRQQIQSGDHICNTWKL